MAMAALNSLDNQALLVLYKNVSFLISSSPLAAATIVRQWMGMGRKAIDPGEKRAPQRAYRCIPSRSKGVKA